MLISSKLSGSKLTKLWSSKAGHSQWKKVGLAATVGISAGIFAAIISVHRPSPVQMASVASTPYIVPVSSTSSGYDAGREQTDASAPPADAEQLERLKVRNRRLEALVTVLRHRSSLHR